MRLALMLAGFSAASALVSHAPLARQPLGLTAARARPSNVKMTGESLLFTPAETYQNMAAKGELISKGSVAKVCGW